MKVPRHLVEARRRRLAALLQEESYLPVQEVCQRLGISEATARRDLAALAGQRRIIRTFGGALSEFNRRFASFRERLGKGAQGKEQIGRQAHALIRPNTTCFFDTGTTVHAIAERLAEQPITPLRVVTNSLPVAERLAQVEGMEVCLLGGLLLPRQSALMGDLGRKALVFHRIDLAFLSAEGMTAEGVWNSSPEIVRFQRELCRRSARHVLCIDHSKLGQRTDHLLFSWPEIETLLTDVAAPALGRAGIPWRPGERLTSPAPAPGKNHLPARIRGKRPSESTP